MHRSLPLVVLRVSRRDCLHPKDIRMILLAQVRHIASRFDYPRDRLREKLLRRRLQNEQTQTAGVKKS